MLCLLDPFVFVFRIKIWSLTYMLNIFCICDLSLSKPSTTSSVPKKINLSDLFWNSTACQMIATDGVLVAAA